MTWNLLRVLYIYFIVQKVKDCDHVQMDVLSLSLL